MIVWLDLEETIITSWSEGLLMNVNKLKNWLLVNDVTEIHIFSYAIWDKEDYKYFVTSGMKEMIETALGVSIVSWISVDELKTKVEYYEGIIYDSRTEFMQINNKEWGFVKYCLSQYKTEECYLIDDTVPNMGFHEYDKLLDMYLINVNSL